MDDLHGHFLKHRRRNNSLRVTMPLRLGEELLTLSRKRGVQMLAASYKYYGTLSPRRILTSSRSSSERPDPILD